MNNATKLRRIVMFLLYDVLKVERKYPLFGCYKTSE